MGACYSVQFKIRIEEGCEDKVFKELKHFIETEDGDGADFKLDKVKAFGNNMETYLDLLKIFFSTCSKPAKDITIESNGCLSYDNDFDASYGWFSIMEEAIYTISTYLDDCSYFCIESDDESELYVIKDGDVIENENKSSFNYIDKLSKILSNTNESEVKSDDDLIITKQQKDYDNTHVLQEGELLKEND